MASYDDPATQTIIKDLQIKFEQEYRSNPDNCIYSDYQRVMTDLHYVYRFYRARHCNPDAALDMMISTMKWRKCTVKLDHYRDYSFPIEFYKVSAVFPYEPDKSGYTTIYIRVSQHRKVPELEEYTKAFFVHVFDKVDRIHGAKGYALVFDLTSASYRNLDWDYLKFMINFGANYCPAGVKYILVLNVPWALNTFRKMVFSFLNDDYFKLIKFVNGNQIYEHIDPENVPHYLGGKCKRNYCSVPKHSMPIEELVERYGYTKDDYKRIIPVYQDALDQADQFLSTVDWNEPEDYFDTPEKDEQELQGTNYEGKNNVQVDLNDNEVIMDPATAFAVKPVDTIEFQYSLIKGRYSGSLRIENNLNKSVCFKVQSNHPNDYQVSPRFGVVKANSAVDITINLLNQDWSHWSKMNMMNRSSKFRILINTCTLNLEETTTIDQFNKQWSTKDKGIYSIIRETRLIKEFPVKMGRRDKFRQPATDLFQHKLPKWSDDLSVEDKLRCLSSSANSLESNQRKLSLMLYLMGFAYLMLFCYFLISNPSFAPSIVN